MTNINNAMVEEFKNVWKNKKNRSSFSTMLYQVIRKEDFVLWLSKSFNDYDLHSRKVLVSKIYSGENKIKICKVLISVILEFLKSKRNKSNKEIFYLPKLKIENNDISEKQRLELLKFIEEIDLIDNKVIYNAFIKLNNYYSVLFQNKMNFKILNVKRINEKSCILKEKIKQHLIYDNNSQDIDSKFKRSLLQLIMILNSGKNTECLIEKSYKENPKKEDSLTLNFNKKEFFQPIVSSNNLFYGDKEIKRSILLSHLISLLREDTVNLGRYISSKKQYISFINIENLKCSDKTFLSSLFVYFYNKR